ncbi:MAG: AI-2E family transporter [Elusimicrobia bacterium]|nr:AI-2E family transporter [Elusimicrobiota bacterium]
MAALNLGGALLAGLFSYMILDLSCRALLRAGCSRRLARWLSLLFLSLAITGGVLLVANFIRNTLVTAPQIAVAVVPKVIEAANRYGVQVPFENVLQLRELALRSLGENLGSVTQATGIFTAGTLRILFSVAVAILFFMTPAGARRGDSLYSKLTEEIGSRISLFMAGFEKVLGAQVIISLINTALTACYLIWSGIPHLAFLIPATFILGIVPIVGNVMSNCLIITTALTISLEKALLSLGFLVFIHTLEHFLNSRIVGGRIEAPMWLTLLSIMVGEIILGVPGIIIAPTLVHYVREELQQVPV